jgi:hypothetical protein
MVPNREPEDTKPRLTIPRTTSQPRFALRRNEAATAFSISPTLFDEWIRLGWMPEGRKIGGVKLWDVEELLEAWHAIGNHLRDKSESNPFDGITA